MSAIQEAKDWVRHWYGERCPDYEENCIICKKWKQFDDLFADIDDLTDMTTDEMLDTKGGDE